MRESIDVKGLSKMVDLSFIERQFPVSKISKESCKERKAGQSQTLTGLGKWWGRKPLLLVRAVILGCLMPASDDPKKDTEVFLTLLSMDAKGLESRRKKKLSMAEICKRVFADEGLSKYRAYFDRRGEKLKLKRTVSQGEKEELERAVFQRLSYDAKIALCSRPEHVEITSQAWEKINQHLKTAAHSLPELVEQLSLRRYGHNVIVGDCFCGGGSIPFEAARIGCHVFASDLNPVAGLLTWVDLHLCGASPEQRKAVERFQKKIYEKINAEVEELGIEENEDRDRALSYLYCLESVCPECRWKIPLLPSLVVGIRGSVTVALKPNAMKKTFDFVICCNVSADAIAKARQQGTVRKGAVICPHCGKSTPISALRHDTRDEHGNTVSNLRLWDTADFEPREDDVFTERLYAVRYEHVEHLSNGKTKRTRFYTAPSKREMENEVKVQKIVRDNFQEWQETGLIPNGIIEKGDKTREVIRNRGWRYWHQLFNPRQLFLLSRFAKYTAEAESLMEKAAGILGLHQCADFNSKLCRWHSTYDKIEQTFYNQALNTLMNWGTRSLPMLRHLWCRKFSDEAVEGKSTVRLGDARDVEEMSDLWITDPPYANAVMYHELSEFFLAWDKKLLPQAFPTWYTDSKRVLAVRGGVHFSQTMIAIYGNLTRHMSDNGLQVVMFTHSDPAVWAQLAIILWKAGLRVTAAWNIATETEASGLKNGNYVKGTVLLILRKRIGAACAFLDEIHVDIRMEVEQQIASMQALDDKEEPNFSDPDYVLAAYAASMKVLTSYESIEDLDLDHELSQAITKPSDSRIVKIIEDAKDIAETAWLRPRLPAFGET